LGLVSDRLEKLFRYGYIRRLSLLAAVITMALYLGNLPFAAAREIYGAAVFVAALQPWKKIPCRVFRKFVAYSYSIYILHFFGVQMLGILIACHNREAGGVLVIFFSLVIYAASFLAAALIRKLFPFDWMLPLVRVPPESIEQSPMLRLDLAEEK
jgi:peptidoglycan/LPS O-acetylase OafA/YrhL